MQGFESLNPGQASQSPFSNAPEVVWQRAVADFAKRHQLPLEAVMAGARFVFRDVGFQLHYNVEVDAQGLVVMMDLGEIPAATAHYVQLGMLGSNARSAAAVLGYQAIIPGTRRAVHCVRLDVGNCDEPSMSISATVVSLALTIEDFRRGLMGATTFNPASASQYPQPSCRPHIQP